MELSTILSTAQRGLSAGNVLIRPVSNPFTILSMVVAHSFMGRSQTGFVTLMSF